MNAEIISTGEELLAGHTINSNATLIARTIAEYGHKLNRVQTVGDNQEEIENALKEGLARNDLLILTGGLGPTPDDLTREAVASALDRPLVEDAASRRNLDEYFGKRKMSANQIKQALFPEGAHILENRAGTAPGCYLEINGKIIILLPGPPGEVGSMLETGVRPLLKRLASGVRDARIIRLFGIGEGDVAEKLGSLLRSENPVTATYADNGEMHIKITASGSTLEETRALQEPVVSEIYKKLGEFCYGEGDESLSYKVNQLLAAQNRTVATAESCTGGWLAQQITSIPGSSAIFHLGIVSYANEAKEKILSVPRTILEQYGAVSSQTALYMARGIRELASSDFGISITGIAGPDGDSSKKPLGLAYLCLSSANHDSHVRIVPTGIWPGREKVRMRAMKTALDMLRRHLLNMPIPEEY